MKWAAEFLEKNSLSEYLKERSLKDTDRPMVKVKVKDHSDSWLKLAGNLLLGADEYLEYLKTQAAATKTEPVRSDEPKKNTRPGHDVCRYCHKDIYLGYGLWSPRGWGQDGPYWLDEETKGSHCGTFHTPTG